MVPERAVDASDEAPPDPAQIRTLDEVAGYLRRLRAWAGHVSYPELVRRINHRRDPRDQARQTTVYDCFRRGRKRLDRRLVLDIAAALGLDDPPRSRLGQAVATALGETEGTDVVDVRASVPRQLPTPPHMFTGRAPELADLDRTPDASAVVITAVDGMAGIGKTALVVYAAHQLAPHFPDGQLFIDLHGFTESLPPVAPGDALDRMLRAVGVPGEQIPAGLDERAAQYRSRLAGQKLLIVLDNAATEDQVAPLLPGEPGCLVLVTSRRRLTGLDHAHTLSLDTLPPPDAITLFARTAGEDHLGTEPPDLLAEIVELCGRLPLAIRIAAARLRSHPTWRVRHLVERLRDHRHRLAELKAGQRSVTAALDLSYQHLTTEQQRTYRLVRLHPGPDIEPYAAAALLDTSTVEARQRLDQQRDAHLLQEPAPGRYVLHDLVRAHAAQTADVEPDRHPALTRLLDHYRCTASAAMDATYPYERERRPEVPPAATPTPDLSDPAQAGVWLDSELPNLLAAAQRAADDSRPDHTRHLSAILHRHLRTRARYRDAEALHQRALITARTAGDRAGERDALLSLGRVHLLQGRHEPAIGHYRSALEIARATGHRPGELDAMVGLGDIHLRKGRHGQAIGHYRSALEIARATGYRLGELDAMVGLGRAHRAQDRYGQAITHYQQAWEIARATGHRPGELSALTGIGDIHQRQGRYEQALAPLGQAWEVARANGHRVGAMNALIGLGFVHRLLGRYEQAIDELGQAWEIARTTGHRVGTLSALIGLGHVYRRQGRHEHAADFYQQVLDLGQESGDRSWPFEARQGMGRLHLATGQPERALADHRRALALATDLRQPSDRARAHDGLAHAHHALRQHEPARQHWQAALDILTSLGTDHTEDEEATVPTIRAHLDQ